MRTSIFSFCLLAASIMAQAQNVLNVDTRRIGASIEPTMYGLFFEDINYAADGGLYGELVKNRSFEFPQSLMGWQSFGNVSVRDDGPFDRCPHYVHLGPAGHKERRTGLVNEGYFGIGVSEGEDYRFSVWARADSLPVTLKVQLIDPNTMEESQVFASETLTVGSTDWQKYELQIHASRTDNDARLRIFLQGDNGVSLEHVSLFPVHTFNDRPNGLRRDIAQALADIQPGVLRFPGGCIVEGEELANRYQWKNTIGPVENRPLNRNRWEFTFEHRYFPDYFQSCGLGFFEFFQLAEDIGAEPLPVLNVGMACQYQNWNDAGAHQPVGALDQYIQDCLDLIEFANGDTTTTWGRKRAEMGHAAPFQLKMLAVGNEQWDTLYYERLRPFVKAIRSRYPDIRIVGTSGPDSEGEMFDRGWRAMAELEADLVDEHFYRNDDWFLSHGLRYDRYARKGPKVFAGEYACHSDGNKRNHFEASLCEAAFMTGLERNADVVHMATYAPLLAHVDGWQWRPDLIWFDNTRTVRTCSYYVQQLYAQNRGTHVLPLTMNGKAVAGQPGQNGLFASSVFDKPSQTVIIKVVNTGSDDQDVVIDLKGLKDASAVTTISLSSSDPGAENTLDSPDTVVPIVGTAKALADKRGSQINDRLPAKTFRLYKIKK